MTYNRGKASRVNEELDESQNANIEKEIWIILSAGTPI